VFSSSSQIEFGGIPFFAYLLGRAFHLQPATGYWQVLSCNCCKIAAMPKYVIERNIPGVGNLTPAELQAISQKSCGVLSNMGPKIQWIQSYVTDDKIYCIYTAPDEATVREHATQGGFPANSVAEVKAVIDPTTAE
jgi:Protein of unknown function (DUF4242)